MPILTKEFLIDRGRYGAGFDVCGTSEDEWPAVPVDPFFRIADRSRSSGEGELARDCGCVTAPVAARKASMLNRLGCRPVPLPDVVALAPDRAPA